MSQQPEFRFFYFTNRYDETVAFYRDILQWKIFRSWDHGVNEKGTMFHSPNGNGFIETEEGNDTPVLQGGIYIQCEVVEEYYEYLCTQPVNITRPLAITSYGHHSFHFKDPNGLEIGLFKYVQ